jgi:hypothetical protein
MVKRTKWARLAPVAAIVAVGISAAPAQAASTRAEYIAQADAICQTFTPSLNQTYATYRHNDKRWARLASHGTLKAWVKQTRRTGAALSRYLQVHAALTEQLAALSPAPGDEALIATWISYRRQAESIGAAAATALSRIDVGKFFKFVGQANKAEFAGMKVVEGFGFQVCG